MRFWMLLLLIACLNTTAIAQMQFTVTSVPDHYTPQLDTVYITGNFNGWNPSDPNHRMVRQPNGHYTVSITAANGSNLEYKFTRGDWDRVETKSDDSFLPNRTLTYTNGGSQSDAIARWADFPGNHSTSGDVQVLDSNFPLSPFNTTRGIWVYLPPDYQSTSKSYPVLYMLDGQNLFDAATTAFGTEWAVDESLEAIHNNGNPTAIIVGIDNGEADRINEYTPWPHPTYGGGAGEKTIAFITDDLKPYIDQHYRTLPGRLGTGIAGSSLGGLMAMYAAVDRPDVFSKAAVFSPSFWYSDSCFWQVRQQGHSLPMRIYMIGGDQEGSNMVGNIYRMQDSLLVHGFSSSEIEVQNHADGQHSEWYWAREFPAAFDWLFAGPLTTRNQGLPNAWKIYVQHNNTFVVQGPSDLAAKLTVYDLNGRTVLQQKATPQQRISLEHLPAGAYRILLQANQDTTTAAIHVWH